MKRTSFLIILLVLLLTSCDRTAQLTYEPFTGELRHAREQVTQGQVVNSLAEAQPGDLVFFDHADVDPQATRITHVGIRLANGERTHHLAQIKRYL